MVHLLKKHQPITVGDFKEMLLKHHVEKYVEVPNKNIVRVSIKKDSLNYYKEKLPTSAISNKKDEKPPQFSFESNERFREEILEFKKQNPQVFQMTLTRSMTLMFLKETVHGFQVH